MTPHRAIRPIAGLIALLLTLSVTSTVTASRADAAPVEITSGSLTWGVKDTWRRYIGYDPTGTKPGGTTAGGGAAITGYTEGQGADAINFPIESGSYDPATKSTTFELAGWMRFQAWYGQTAPGKYALDTEFKDLKVVITEDAQILRGTHVGYLRSDPGGDLHEDVDVVLAKYDVSGATTSFGPPTTTWTDVPTTAGPGLSIYGEGTVLDRTTFTYEGPGGVPDLEERFDVPGAPVIEAGPLRSSGSSVTPTSGSVRQGLLSGDTKTLFTFTRAGANQPLVVTAVDTETMEPIGQTYSTPMRGSTSAQSRQLRITIDPETDTLYYLGQYEGEPVVGNTHGMGVEHVVHALAWDGSAFTESTVGRLRDSAVTGSTSKTVGTVPTGQLTWNPVTEEVMIPVAVLANERPDRWTTDDLYRFRRAGSGWERSITKFSLPTSGGQWANVASNRASPVSSTLAYRNNVAVLGDGSYVFTPSSLPVAGSGQTATFSGALNVDPGNFAQASTVATEIPGTVLPLSSYTIGETTTYYYAGYSAATALGDGRVLLHGDSGSLTDFVAVSVDDGTVVAGEPFVGPDTTSAAFGVVGSGLATSATPDPSTPGAMWLSDLGTRDGDHLRYFRGNEDVAGYAIEAFTDQYFFALSYELHGLANGDVIVPVKDADTKEYGWQRWDNRGLTPTVTTQPGDAAVTIPTGADSVAATFSTAASGGTVQWQRKRVGEARFTDLGGATSATLTIDATPADDGATFRAKVSNSAGKVASRAAELSVAFAPQIVQQPLDVDVAPGEAAVFSTLWEANPADVDVVWQRKSGGFWTTIGADDASFEVDGGTLRLAETEVAQSGAAVRAKLTNAVGAAYTRPATLTVTEPVSGAGTISDVTLEWTGNPEMQGNQPNGQPSFFSAGVSDGSEATYRSTSGGVSIVHRDGDEQSPATWATRKAHAETPVNDPDTQQVVLVDGGTGTRTADGTVRIGWRGSWSVNFYGGLTPFTFTDPRLVIEPDGRGRLIADLSGYGSTLENPEERDPVAPVDDVVVATFDDAEYDPAGGSIALDYGGVEITAPTGATAQNRTADGWGAWPQSFVDFHGATGLHSYWYSSGGSFDPLKAPSPLALGASTWTPGEVALEAPEIVTQPSAVMANLGEEAQLIVGATGDELAYQWQRKVGSSWIDLPDERSAALTLTAVTTDDDGAAFRVKVSNAAGAATSHPAEIDVNHPPVLADVSTTSTSGTNKVITLLATDADGDAVALTESSADASLSGSKLTVTVPRTFTGTRTVEVTATDTHNVSTTAVVKVVVGKAASKVTIKAAPSSIKDGQTSTISATVTSRGQVQGGRIDLYSNGKRIALLTVPSSGKVAYTTPRLGRGVRTLQATYVGTGSTAAATSATTKLSVR